MNVQGTVGLLTVGVESHAVGVVHVGAQVSSAEVDVGPAVTVSISQAGATLGELASLRDQDPAAFEVKLTAMSNRAREAALGASGDQARALNDLADRLAAAQRSGDLAVLTSLTGAAAST